MGSIAPYIHRKVVVLQQDDTAESAAKAMASHGIGSVVVADHQGHLVGIVTDRDLAFRVLAREKPRDAPLSEIMSRELQRVPEDASLESVIHMMATHGIRRVPVVQKAGHERCVGLVSLDDLIAAREIDDYHLVRVVKSQLLRRIRSSRQHQRLSVVEVEPELSSDRSLESLRSAVMQATRLTEHETSKVLSIVLTSLVARLHHTGAVYLIASLPRPLQEELLPAPAGPDPGVSAHAIVSRVMTDLEYPQSVAHSVVGHTLGALEKWIGLDRFEHVKFQLPKDIWALFGAEKGRRPAA